MKYAGYIMILLSGIAVSLTTTGCMSAGNSAAAEVDPAGWHRNDVRTVVFPNTDTVSLRNIEVFIVCDETFAYSNDSLVLSVTTTTPDSLRAAETLVIRPADKGHVESPGYREYSFPYRNDALLSREGDYLFGFSHDGTVVKGLKAIGVTVKK